MDILSQAKTQLQLKVLERRFSTLSARESLENPYLKPILNNTNPM